MRIFTLCLLLALRVSAALGAPPADGDSLRAFLAEMIEASGPQPRGQQAAQMRTALAGHSDLLVKMMNPAQAAQIVQEAGFPASWVPQLSDTAASLLEALQGIAEKVTPAQREALLRKTPNALFEKLAGKVEGDLNKMQFSQVSGFGEVSEQLRTIRLNGFSDADIEFLASAFLKYIDRAPPKIKRRMIAAWLRVPAKALWPEQLSAVLQNAGPGVQKVFQLIGRESDSEELTEVSTKLLSNIRPAPFSEVKKVIEADYGKPLEQIFGSFNEKAIKAGTVGQLYKATTLDGRETAVKALRPEIEEEMRDDMDVLVDLAKGNVASHTFLESARESFTDELDLRNEGEHIGTGQMYVDRAKGLAAPKLTKDYTPTKNVLAMDWVEGATIENSNSVDPRIRAQALSAVMEKWFNKAMTTGFFHGDLHPGNMMLQLLEGTGKLRYLATFLDFGAAGNLSVQQRRGLIYLYAATIERNPEAVVEAIETSLAQVPAENREALLARIKKILGSKMQKNRMMSEIVSQALRLGVKVDKKIVMFSRTSFFLMRELEKVNTELRNKFPNAKITGAARIYAKAAALSMGEEVWKRAIGDVRGDEGAWDLKTIKRIVEATVKDGTIQMQNRCTVYYGKLAPLVGAEK